MPDYPVLWRRPHCPAHAHLQRPQMNCCCCCQCCLAQPMTLHRQCVWSHCTHLTAQWPALDRVTPATAACAGNSPSSLKALTR
eukprot:11140068-Alexandrium_andersonii.AAC.1